MNESGLIRTSATKHRDDGEGEGRGDDTTQRRGRPHVGPGAVGHETPGRLEIHRGESALAKVGGHPVERAFDDQAGRRGTKSRPGFAHGSEVIDVEGSYRRRGFKRALSELLSAPDDHDGGRAIPPVALGECTETREVVLPAEAEGGAQDQAPARPGPLHDHRAAEDSGNPGVRAHVPAIRNQRVQQALGETAREDIALPENGAGPSLAETPHGAKAEERGQQAQEDRGGGHRASQSMGRSRIVVSQWWDTCPQESCDEPRSWPPSAQPHRAKPFSNN